MKNSNGTKHIITHQIITFTTTEKEYYSNLYVFCFLHNLMIAYNIVDIPIHSELRNDIMKFVKN